METVKKNVKVNIFGSEYTLVANANDNGEIYKIAEYVDSKMREIQALKPNRPLHQIAILTALNITGELFQLHQQESKDFIDFKTKVKYLADKLELGMLDKPEDDTLLRD
ncbi:cell division protein ZapA [candidate division KSB1 bacterium]|nr:cell division protein ZapA [candidate division KSB1 bacterium]RQW03760.1 MAG: cell division protein ZapA [candidate division KSB1 bacterium]